jgi:Integrase core domain
MSKVRFVGFDVHAETIAIAVADAAEDVRSIGVIPNRAESIRKLAKKLGPADQLRVCYEAGPTGYVVYRQLTELGVTCEVVAPTLVPRDRDQKWSGDVRHRLRYAGISVVRIPARAPNANAYAEPFVRSIKTECLDRLIPVGESHFRRAVTEFVAHYHHKRNHQGLNNRLVAAAPVVDWNCRVRRHRRLGGLLNFYERAA